MTSKGGEADLDAKGAPNKNEICFGAWRLTRTYSPEYQKRKKGGFCLIAFQSLRVEKKNRKHSASTDDRVRRFASTG